MVVLEASQSVVLPAKAVERVFIGMGWTDAGGKTIDLDCSVVGYTANGERDAQSTVWYGQLRNGAHKSKSTGSSIVHTGDVLKGQAAGYEDAERIYVWLSELPDNLSTIAFAADVFTDGVTFSELSTAYVRLCSAHTGQELASLSPAAESLY